LYGLLWGKKWASKVHRDPPPSSLDSIRRRHRIAHRVEPFFATA
jgi:hypothetical protein